MYMRNKIMIFLYINVETCELSRYKTTYLKQICAQTTFIYKKKRPDILFKMLSFKLPLSDSMHNQNLNVYENITLQKIGKVPAVDNNVEKIVLGVPNDIHRYM